MVDVIGLPGIGKSTFLRDCSITEDLFDTKPEDKITFIMKLRIKLLTIILICTFLRSNLKLIKYVFLNRNRFWIFKKISFRIILNKHKKNRKSHYEQGILQVLVTDAVEQAKHFSIIYYEAIFQMLDLKNPIISFVGKPQLAFKRYKLRGEKEHREIDSDAIKDITLDRFEFGAELIDRINILAEIQLVPNLKIDLENSHQDNTRLIDIWYKGVNLREK